MYADGRYVEAAEVFERTERGLRNLSPSDQACYGLYRGMTFLALGDFRHARQWLSFGYKVEKKHPGALGTDQRRLLDRAWIQLASRSYAPLPSGANRQVAAATVAATSPPGTADPVFPAQQSPAPPSQQHSVDGH
jgi:hypothetical protein